MESQGCKVSVLKRSILELTPDVAAGRAPRGPRDQRLRELGGFPDFTILEEYELDERRIETLIEAGGLGDPTVITESMALRTAIPERDPEEAAMAARQPPPRSADPPPSLAAGGALDVEEVSISCGNMPVQ